jgi:hypothetical protein
MSLLGTGREVVAGLPVPLVYTLDVERLIEIAQNRLTRSFTAAECDRYLHRDECPARRANTSAGRPLRFSGVAAPNVDWEAIGAKECE